MNQEIYALIIGIASYSDTGKVLGMNDIPCAADDAAALEKLLITSGGLKTFNVRTLINSQATWAGIDGVLNDWGGDNGRANAATVLFFFSGHGYRRKAGAEAGSYLCAWDADTSQHPPTNVFRFDQLRDALHNLKADRLFLFLDACYSAGLAGSDGLVDFAEFGGGDEFSILASSKGNETSKCGNPHSLYTTYLLEALAGKGSDPTQPFIRFGTLSEYVSDNVVAQSHDTQHPLATRNGKHPEILPNPLHQDTTAPTADQLTPPKPPAPNLITAFAAADWRGKLADYLAATIAANQATADDDVFLAISCDSLRNSEAAPPTLLTQLVQRWTTDSNCWFPSNFNGPDIFTLYEQCANPANPDPVIQRFAALINGGPFPRPTWAWWKASDDKATLAQISTALRVIAARFVSSKVTMQTEDRAIVANLTPVATTLAAAAKIFGGDQAATLIHDAVSSYLTIVRANVRLAQASIHDLADTIADQAQLQPQVDAAVMQSLAPLDQISTLDPSPLQAKQLQKARATAYYTLSLSLPLTSAIRADYEKRAMDIWNAIFQQDNKDDEVCVSMANALRSDPANLDKVISLYKIGWTRSNNNHNPNWVAGLEYVVLASQLTPTPPPDTANTLLELAPLIQTLSDDDVRRHDYRLADVYIRLGNVYYNLGDYSEACKLLASAIDKANDKPTRELAILSYSRACLMRADFTAPYPQLTSMRDKPIADIRIYYYLAAVAGPNNDNDSRNWAIKKALERESNPSLLPLSYLIATITRLPPATRTKLCSTNDCSPNPNLTTGGVSTWIPLTLTTRCSSASA